jgi:hypothetical protein
MGTSSANADRLFGLVGRLGDWVAAVDAAAWGYARGPGGSSVESVITGVRLLADQQRGVSTGVTAVANAFIVADQREQFTVIAKRMAAVRRQSEQWRTNHADDLKGLYRSSMVDILRGRLLRFDPTGHGRVVEVLGDLASADHVAVVIPGMTNDIDNYLTGHRPKAENLLKEMQRRARPGEKVCVISWLGYDTPGMSLTGLAIDARRSTLAIAGAKNLGEDLQYLSSVNRRAHVTVIGHSYGSVVLGRAMRDGLRAKDAVAVGSPGMDADDRSELGSPKTTLWATRKRGRTIRIGPTISPLPLPFTDTRLPRLSVFPGVGMMPVIPVDPVALAPGHGEDPASKGFHSRRFPSGKKVSSHGGYFNPGTEALQNMALIATGQKPSS